MNPDEPRTDAFRTDRPLPPRPLRDLPPDLAPVPRSPLWTKLHFLREAQKLVANATRRAAAIHLFGIFLGLGLSLPLAFLAGGLMHMLVYDDPYQHVSTSRNEKGEKTYLIRGQEVTQQQYDDFLVSENNSTTAATLAIIAGFMLIVMFIILFWVLFRPRRSPMAQTVEEQIATIIRDHPEAVASWGGEWVLRVPKFVAQLLDLEREGPRR